MFTGLIEEIGTVRQLERCANFQRLEIAARTVLEGTAIGDSISVNGACQTVVEQRDGAFWVESVAETLKRTTLGMLAVGNRVNLERSMRASDRIGGHMVLGHVDTVGSIRRFDRDGENQLLEVTVPTELSRFIAGKGSVAVDGISLTVVEVLSNCFTVAIIPHTLQHTNLSGRQTGDCVNLEIDVLARYVARQLEVWDDDCGGLSNPVVPLHESPE